MDADTRRCVNLRSPVEDEDVNEIPESDFIRLSNGAVGTSTL